MEGISTAHIAGSKFASRPSCGKFQYCTSVLDLGLRLWYLIVSIPDLCNLITLISFASLGPRASTKDESHVNFTESQKVSQPIFFLQY